MFDRKTIIIGGSLIALLLIISGVLVWQVVDNHSKQSFIDKQNQELKNVKDSSDKIRNELNQSTIDKEVKDRENEIKNTTINSSWKENVINCLKNYNEEDAGLDTEKKLQKVFLSNSYNIVCDRLWHGTKVLSNDLNSEVTTGSSYAIDSVREGISFIKGDKKYIEIITGRPCGGCIGTAGLLEINTENDAWKLIKNTIPNFVLREDSLDRTKTVYVKDGFGTEPKELYIYNFLNGSSRKIFDIPNGYSLGAEGPEGYFFGGGGVVKWVNNETIKFTMNKTCIEGTENCNCDEFGCYDRTKEKEIILNNL